MVKETTIEDLARMVEKGFGSTAKDIKGLDSRMDKFDSRMDKFDSRMDKFDSRMDNLETKVDDGFKRMDERFGQVNARLDMIEGDIKTFVTKDEFEDLMGRVKYLELKLGVESGK